MYEVELKANVTPLAHVECDCGTENVWLKAVSFPWRAAHNSALNTRGFYVVSHNVMDWEKYCWDEVFTDLREAVGFFGKQANKRYDNGEKKYEKVVWEEEWKSYREDLIPYEDDGHYHSSASNGDYGPSNPWDAPGMSVSDFLPGVY